MDGATHIFMTRAFSQADRHKKENQIKTGRLFGKHGLKMSIIR